MTLAIIVPVLERPQNAWPFMRSIARCEGMPAPTHVYAVADEADEATTQAWYEHGAHVLISEYGTTFPHKAQWAWERAGGLYDWVFLCGDDVTFKDNWWVEAMKIAKLEPDARLLATNDLHNPFVTGGVHATHPIIRTDWIIESGASWDGPGHLVHRGYYHSYCDNEWTKKALDEGVFCPALTSIVEHRHPTWGTAPWDNTYAIPVEHLGEDALLWEERRRSAERLRRKT